MRPNTGPKKLGNLKLLLWWHSLRPALDTLRKFSLLIRKELNLSLNLFSNGFEVISTTYCN